VKLSDSNHDG
jgi:hypothetical protein